MPLTPTRVLRVFGYAMFFDGVDDYVLVPYSASIDFSGVRQLTYCGWINLITPTRGDLYITLFFGTDYWDIYWRATDDSPYFQWRGTDGVVRAFLKDGLYLARRVFHHICFSMDFTGSQSSLEVVDGVLQASSTITQMFSEANRSVPFPETTFNGYIVQVLLYSRALSDSEIAWNYLYPDNPVRNGLVLWLQADPSYVKDVDGDGILEWVDLSGYGNHGKVYGATLVQLVKTPSRVLSPARVSSPAR
jgi:hypothetical protein